MSTLAEQQAAFARALLAGETAAAETHIAGPHPDQRLAVYRNNVMHSLIEALGSVYPVVQRLGGDEWFRAVAAEYVRSHPPHQAALMGYGGAFAEFLERFPAAAALGYLGEVARLERAWLDAWHGPEAEPLAATVLGELPPEQLVAVRLRLHPTARRLANRYPASRIWEAHQGEGDPSPFPTVPEAEWVLVMRPRQKVVVQRLPAGAFALLEALEAGASLGEAAAAACEAEPGFDVIHHFSSLLAAGTFAGLDAGHEENSP